VRFLSDLQFRRRLESCAAELAARYGWPSIAARFGEVLEQVRGQCALGRSLRECGSPKVGLSCDPEFLSGEQVADH